jgi:hypothetical protein
MATDVAPDGRATIDIGAATAPVTAPMIPSISQLFFRLAQGRRYGRDRRAEWLLLMAKPELRNDVITFFPHPSQLLEAQTLHKIRSIFAIVLCVLRRDNAV